MKVFKSAAIFIVTFLCMTVLPRNIWFYAKCKNIKSICSACCDDGLSLSNRTIIVPDSTRFSSSIDFQEKYGIHVVSRSVWKTDSSNGRKIFEHIIDSPSVILGGRRYFRATSSNTYFIKGVELVREDFKIAWMVAYAYPIYSENKFMIFIDAYESKSEQKSEKTSCKALH